MAERINTSEVEGEEGAELRAAFGDDVDLIDFTDDLRDEIDDEM